MIALNFSHMTIIKHRILKEKVLRKCCSTCKTGNLPYCMFVMWKVIVTVQLIFA